MSDPSRRGCEPSFFSAWPVLIMASSSEDVLIGAIDQGTSSSRFILFDSKATPLYSHQIEFESITPSPGYVEHDPFVLLNTVKDCIREVAKQFSNKNKDKKLSIRGVGIANQRETTLVWDRNTGKPLHNAIGICKIIEKMASKMNLSLIRSPT